LDFSLRNAAERASAAFACCVPGDLLRSHRKAERALLPISVATCGTASGVIAVATN